MALPEKSFASGQEKYLRLGLASTSSTGAGITVIPQALIRGLGDVKSTTDKQARCEKPHTKKDTKSTGRFVTPQGPATSPVQDAYGRLATISISTSASRASPVTPIQVRAGNRPAGQ